MRIRLFAAVLLLCAVAFAQTITVDQLVGFMRSSIKLKTPDSKVADSLKTIKLSQRLEDRVIEQLQTEGLGPRAVAGLRALGASSANLPVAEIKAPTAAPEKPPEAPPPSAEQQKKVLAEAREYALNYSKNLPNFICAQSTRRFAGTTQYDNVLAKLTYYDQHEKYETITVNDKPSQVPYETLGGSISTGEFGSMLRGIFDPSTEANFEWSTWRELGKHKTYVFRFSVDQPHSSWQIEDRESHVKISPAYYGFVWIDTADNTVLKFTMKALDLPSTFRITEADSSLEYDNVEISGVPFMLPAKAVMHLRAGRDDQRNEITFHNYHKYSADAVLSFSDVAPDSATTPDPKDKSPDAPKEKK